jgi:O-antigen ligase
MTTQSGLRLVRPHLDEWRRPERLLWLVPLGIFVTILFSPVRLELMVAALFGSGAVLLMARRPLVPLVALVIGLPVSQLALATLFKLGVSGALVRPLGQWKEAAVAAVVVAALVRFRRDRPPPDLIDKLALGYIGIGVLYLVIPALLVLGGSERTLSDRGLGFRSDVLYVVLFLAARHVRLSSQHVAVMLKALLLAVTVVGGIGVFEWLDSDTWNRIVIEDVELPRYRLDVLGVDPVVGSLLFDPLSTAFFLAFGVGVIVELFVRGRGRRWILVGCGLAVAALFFTQTRAGLLAAALAVVVAVRPMRGRSRGNRIRFSLALAGVAVFVVPAVIGAGLSDRLSGDEASDSIHRESFTNGISTLARNPLGLGLATSAGAGQRVSDGTAVVTENQYLQIGIQLGVPAMALYVGLVIAVPRLLRRRLGGGGEDDDDSDPERDDHVAGGAVRVAFIGLCVGGFFLQPFVDFSVSWVAWAVLGACLGSLDNAGDPGLGAPAASTVGRG